MHDMRYLKLAILFIWAAACQQAPANNAAALQSAQFEVKGNCGMCKKTIEKAAKSVEGVQMADWNKSSHQFKVDFDAAKTDVAKIHSAIAASGYDTDQVRGNDEAYNNLHECCHYERRQ
jgi:periplasmic mercuric ion binding protein